MAAELKNAGVPSAEALREMGADMAYAKLLATGSRPHFIAYYALVMGLQGRPWNDCQGKEKADLRTRFDTIVKGAALKDTSKLARALDEVGIRLDS